ncbi:unnamed protein product [Cuscuta europaea]|uniref:Uncharacterized protein n=2 Tax=Cuscuta europaea TaxID=41803 RepID=A0A9P0ZG89_CUSEU|nr:unnamed protein product [Cuscuta europaea]
MSNLVKLEFAALDISGKNYLSWVLDAEIHLDAKSLGDTIKIGNTASKENKTKAMIFLRHHLHEDLKSEYLTERDPLELWENLKQRYDHQKITILPATRYEWTHLRLQDFKSVVDYNSAMYIITSQLRLCGEKIIDDEMLEKTYSTFHPSNSVLSQQHRQKGFTKYFDLMNQLLVAEKNNEFILKNHQTCPTGSTPAPFPEANAVTNNNSNKKERRHASRRGRGHGRGRGRGSYHGNRGGHTHRGGYRGGRVTHFKGPSRHQKWQKNENYGKG